MMFTSVDKNSISAQLGEENFWWERHSATIAFRGCANSTPDFSGSGLPDFVKKPLPQQTPHC
jgi:hypothetical protein